MPYSPPSIGASGLTIPSYDDILNDLIASAQSIYGADIYLAPDTADYQFLSIIALKIFDCHSALQLSYNNKSPKTAVGAALDSIVKLNGIRRKAASYSTCSVTLTGTAGTIVSNGVVRDMNGNKWSLPPVVTIGGGGTVSVTATCQILGAITAQVGDLSIIDTPQLGWVSVTNPSTPSPGLPVETDSQLRSRQSISVSKPSMTMLAGTVSAIASLAGVTRSVVYENPTGSVDSNGLPAHSIAAVVENGADVDIANAIYLNRGIGCLTDGTTTVAVTDPITGTVMNINFYRPSYKNIDVVVQVHQLTGYTSATTAAIQQAIKDFLNGYRIGETLAVNSVYGPALSAIGDPLNPLYYVRGITACLHGGTPGTSDIVAAFNEVIECTSLANITISSV